MKLEMFLISIVFVVLVSGCVSEILTPERVLELKDSLVGQRISVIGGASIDTVICTEAVCTPEYPCCNGCSANLMLEGSNREMILLYGVYEGVAVECSGNNCEFMENCYPLEIGKRYEVTGMWTKTRFEYYLEIEDFREIV
jgi:hypothetical protein